jgi:curved DNA-binding protein CbpA
MCEKHHSVLSKNSSSNARRRTAAAAAASTSTRRFQSSVPQGAEEYEEDDYDPSETINPLSTHSDTETNNNNNPRATTTTTNTPENVMDYFALLGVPRKFGLDPQQLKERYLELMTLFHPDKQHSQQQQQQQPSSSSHHQSLSANDITNAYQTLRDSHTRASHLLELYGSPILEGNASKGNNHGNDDGSSSPALVGMEFLMKMMEWRERIETLALCSGEKDTHDGPCSCGSYDKNKELKELWDETQYLQAQHEQELETLLDFSSEDDDSDGKAIILDDETLQRARKLTAKLQYWHRLETTLREEMDV